MSTSLNGKTIAFFVTFEADKATDSVSASG
jgi:hypothetical protein